MLLRLRRVIFGTSRTDENFVQESRFLVDILHCQKKAREKLLLHPLAQAYIYLKWKYMLRLFWLSYAGYVSV